jgi:pimeloyl-ACP methyl ester carboxylesterase
MEHPEATRRLVAMNCPHPAIFSQHLRSDPAQLARSWYMFFFQIPWLPETLLGLNDAWAIANAVRQSAVRREAITDDDLAVLRAAASQPGALEAAINYYRAVFRGPEMTASWPAWLRRFVYGDQQPQAPARLRIEDWPKISAPTLFIWGEQDVALSKELTVGLEALLTGPITRRFIPNCGHWVQQEQAELVNESLLEFLDDLAPAATPAAS